MKNRLYYSPSSDDAASDDTTTTDTATPTDSMSNDTATDDDVTTTFAYPDSSDSATDDSAGSGDSAAGGAGGSDAGASDSSQLYIADLIISPDGGDTSEEFPKPGVAYDFTAAVINRGSADSGGFFVKFQFDPDSANPNPDADLTAKQDDGLKGGAQFRAVSHFGTFPNVYEVYHLKACVYANSAPEQAISCTTFDFYVNTAD